MQQIEVRNIKVDVVRKDIKNIHLAVYPPNGRVRLAAPQNINDEAIRLFIISKLAWIKRQQRKFEEQERETDREFSARESHYFLGQRYLLNVVEQKAVPKVEIRNKTYIDLFIRPGSSIEKRHEVMTEWYRAELKKLIPLIIEKYEKKLGVSCSEWGVKHMKTKWGTCNIEKKRIWLNLELAKKPIICLEYIILHELIHLIERHHNDNFLAYMDKYMPHWKFHREELNKLPVSHTEWKY